MKHITVFFILISVLIPVILFGQVFSKSWNRDEGIPYHQSFDMNTGFHSFAFTDDGNVAFLLKQDKSIRVFDMGSGEKVRDISIQSCAKDMYYDDGSFYVLYQGYVSVISLNGDITEDHFLQKADRYEKVTVNDGVIYVHSTNNQTLKYTPGNSAPTVFSHNKNLFADNISVSTVKTSNHSFTINFNSAEKNFQTVKKLASASVAGYSNDNIYIDVQYIVHEIPLKVEREIWIISAAGDVTGKVVVPDCYYIFVKSDIVVTGDGCFYSLTTPARVEIYRIEEGTMIPLAAEFSGYHFNNYLLPSEEVKTPESGGPKAPITRAQIIANAEPYETHTWYCNASNIKDYFCGGKQVVTPSWVTVGNHNALPYMWGGWSNLTQFDTGLLNDVSAGDCNTTGGSAGSSCAVGVDCSGFVSRAWGLTSKYGTSTLPNISTAYSSYSDLLPGDIVNYAGSHVRLIHTLNTNGTFYIIESSASATDWRVGYTTYTVANLQPNYIPRYYNDVINTIPDNTPPQTTMATGNWHTDDFDVNYTDTDSSGIQSLFWLPAGLNGSNWTANQSFGFMYNNFSETVYPDWTLVEPTWAFSGGTLGQSNEALTQNNAYSSLAQDSTSAYLFHWKMKLSGSGTDRRAGAYIFADSATALQRNNAYMVYYRADLDVCQIYKSVNNSITLMTEDPCVIDETNWFDCKVIYNPASGTVTAYLNDEPITTWTDPSPLKAGKYLSLRTGACNALYDEFRVYRSRGSVTNITVGAGEMINEENPNPSTPACIIHSIAIDNADNFMMTNLATNIDHTPPLTIAGISDINPADIDTMHTPAAVNAYWDQSSDPNSGLNGYMFALGTAPGLDDVFAWTNEADTSGLCSVSLTEDEKYYFSVKAINNAGLESVVSSSDGFLYDLVTYESINDRETAVAVYPNPVKEDIHLKFNISENANGYFEIYDIKGEKVISQKVSSSHENISISVKGLSEGLYMYRFIVDGEIYKQGKLIISI